MSEIALKDVEKYYGTNHILKGVSFEVESGEKIGLLGKNGAGKTTLFKIIAGFEPYDAGGLYIRKDAVVALLEQMPEYPDTPGQELTVRDLLCSAFAALTALQTELRELEHKMTTAGDHDRDLLQKYGRLQQVFETRGGYTIEESIGKICTGLKINDQMLQKSFSRLSGGEKTIVLLGKILLMKPDILLLDEPTNHLDLNMVEWLEEFLQKYNGTVILISHDRFFLDRVINRVVEIQNGRAELYTGNYSAYVREKEVRFLEQLEKYEQEQKKVKQLETAAKRMHEWALRADNPAMHRRAFSMEKRIERIKQTDRPLQEKSLTLSFREHDFSGRDVISIRNLVKSYHGRKVLDHLDLLVQSGERVAILGANGSGKSTLLKAVTGDVNVEMGEIVVGPSIIYAYLEQEVTFAQPEWTILETVRQEFRIGEGPARNLLAKYLFRSEDVYKTVKNLSGGEKSRLRLCLLLQEEVNLLLLDEPTNHLDIDSREALEDALTDFGGTMVFVSHDRYFINKFATRIALLQNGRLQNHHGDYASYRAQKLAAMEKTSPKPSLKQKCEPVRKEITRKNATTAQVDRTKIEERIRALEERLTSLEKEMEGCGSDFVTLTNLYQQKTELEKERDGLYEEWMNEG